MKAWAFCVVNGKHINIPDVPENCTWVGSREYNGGGGGEGGVKKKRVPGNDADASFELKRANKT